MTATFDTDVAIVGGGPVGTALSVALAQQGVTSIVIERHATPQPVPKGQNLTQRTMEHFRRWGLEEALRDARTLPRGLPFSGMTAFGSLLGEHHYPWLERGSVDEFYAARNERLPQYATEGVLRERAMSLPEVDYRTGWTAEGVVQDADGVTVQIVDRTEARDEVRARFVVGADGSRSRVRTSVGITQTLADHDRVMVLLVFRSREFDTIMERFPGVAFVNVMNPELEGYWQFFGRVDAKETWFFHAPVEADKVQDVDLSALLERAVGQRFPFDVEYLGQWDLRFALADTYRAGRTFIVGDACHSHPPYGGYGINSGFEDATNLAWKLAAELHGWAGPALLDSYDAERRPVFASTRDDFIDRSIRDDRSFVAEYSPDRDGAAFDAEWARRSTRAQDEVRAFEPHYNGSPLIGGAGTPSALGDHMMRARAGHHLAPGVTAAGGEVFDSLTADRFTLLVSSSGDASSFVEAATRRGVPLAVVVIGATTTERYQAPVILVRPDGFVAWAGSASADAHEIVARSVGGGAPADARSRSAANAVLA